MVVVCVHCRFLQSIVSDERVLITAASIQWVSELMFVPHSMGSEFLAAVGSLFLSRWIEYIYISKYKKERKSFKDLMLLCILSRKDLMLSGAGLSEIYMVVWHARVRNCWMCLRKSNFLHWDHPAFLFVDHWVMAQDFDTVQAWACDVNEVSADSDCLIKPLVRDGIFLFTLFRVRDFLVYNIHIFTIFEEWVT